MIGRARPKRRMVTRTLRLYEDVDQKLEEFARKQNLSVSAVTNHWLKRLVEWEILAERLNFVTVHSRLLVKFLDGLPDNLIREIAGWAAKNTTERMNPFKAATLETIVGNLEFQGTYSRLYKIDWLFGDTQQKIVLTHEMGPKWSVFCENFLKQKLSDLGSKTRVTTHITEGQVVAEVSQVPILERRPVEGTTARDFTR